MPEYGYECMLVSILTHSYTWNFLKFPYKHTHISNDSFGGACLWIWDSKTLVSGFSWRMASIGFKYVFPNRVLFNKRWSKRVLSGPRASLPSCPGLEYGSHLTAGIVTDAVSSRKKERKKREKKNSMLIRWHTFIFAKTTDSSNLVTNSL